MFESFNALINEPMSRHTTLRLGGPADYLVFPRSSEEIRAMFAEAGAYSVEPEESILISLSLSPFLIEIGLEPFLKETI